MRRRCIWRNGRRPPARKRAKWCMRAFRAIGTWDAFARTGRWCSYLKSIIPSSLSAKMSWSMGIPRWFWRDWSDLTGPQPYYRKQRSLFWDCVCSETNRGVGGEWRGFASKGREVIFRVFSLVIFWVFSLVIFWVLPLVIFRVYKFTTNPQSVNSSNNACFHKQSLIYLQIP